MDRHGLWHFLGNDDSKLTDAIRDIQHSGLNIEDQGHPVGYVGFNIKKMKDGSYEFTQRALIDSIIEDVGLKDAKVKPSLHVWQVTYPKQPKWGSVTKIEYFGTYIRYLPTNPTSPHCVTPFQLIPDHHLVRISSQ